MKMNVLAAASNTRCVLQCFEPLYAKKVTSEKQFFSKSHKRETSENKKKITSE